jgi:hypothetical protein
MKPRLEGVLYVVRAEAISRPLPVVRDRYRGVLGQRQLSDGTVLCSSSYSSVVGISEVVGS